MIQLIKQFSAVFFDSIGIKSSARSTALSNAFSRPCINLSLFLFLISGKYKVVIELEAVFFVSTCLIAYFLLFMYEKPILFT